MKEKSEVSRSNLMPKIVQSSSSRPLPFLESSPFSRSSPSDLRDFLVSVRESRERERERDLDLGERDLFRPLGEESFSADLDLDRERDLSRGDLERDFDLDLDLDFLGDLDLNLDRDLERPLRPPRRSLLCDLDRLRLRERDLDLDLASFSTTSFSLRPWSS